MKTTSKQQQSDLPKLSQPARRALADAGIQGLQELTRFSEAEIRHLHGMGPKALGELRQALAEKGLSFAQAMKPITAKEEKTASTQIDYHIKQLGDWRGKMLARLRKLILEAAPELTEEWKWDTPVWSYKGNVVAAGVFKDHVKLNFFKGASLVDPPGLFNSGLDAKATRAIDCYETDEINEPALKALVRAAVAYNQVNGNKKK